MSLSSLTRRLYGTSPKDLVEKILRRMRRSRPRWHEVKGGPLQGGFVFVDRQGSPAWAEMVDGTYDQFIYDALGPYGYFAGKVVWDVGAHFGYHSMAFTRLVGPTGSVIAFEPNPSNVERFEKNMQRNEELAKRLTLLTCALSDKDGKSSFVFSERIDNGGSSGSHLTNAVSPLERERYWSFSSRTVETVRADTLIGEGRISPPDIVKIDVEGAEHMVLLGGLEMLKKHRPMIVAEIHNIVMMYHVQKILREYGYDVRILDEHHATASRCFIQAIPATELNRA